MRKLTKIAIGAAIILLLAFIVYWILYNRYISFRHQNATPDSTIIEMQVPRLFGFAIDSFHIETGIIEKDYNLGKILQKYALPDRALIQLLTYSGDVFDVRKLRQGNNYTIFLSKDTLYRLQYFVYEHTPVDYVVFDFTDSLKISLKQKDVTVIRKKIHGDITTSLWDAITKNNINPLVALELSDMYAWTVDFFGLQPGDNFTVVFDEQFVDTVPIGLGRIHAASFYHGGRNLLAIPFTQDSIETYFDAEGNSLRRAFRKAPLRFNRISSRFSGSRLHPILKIRRPHYGVDYAAPIGTPVYSIGDGYITEVSYQSGSGRMVKVRHNSVYTSVYMHLSGYGKGIRSGKYVLQGELLGYVGSSGLSTGPHLDFRVYRNGSPIDPLKMESPPVDPIKPENMQAFDSVKMVAMRMLDESGMMLVGEE
jgi:murein DD-endopeptidase MepM/ murein hydrolase activator NlpD